VDWNDLPYFLAVINGGNLSRAAARLGVNHSTVFRRINGMEQRLGSRLFERLPEGYVLTETGRRAAEFAIQAEESVHCLERLLAGRDVELSGQVRMTTAPDLARLYVAPCLARFRQQYPGIRVEVAVSDSDYDLGRREADLALRATPAPPDHLVGRRVCDLVWQAWASPGYLDASGRPRDTRDLAAHRLIGSDEGFRRVPIFDWLQRTFPQERFVASAGDLSTMAALAAADLGVAILPHDPTEGAIQPLFPVAPPHYSRLWILTHRDLKNVARIRTLANFLFDFLRRAIGNVARHETGSGENDKAPASP
jgi:DNA-binding transcriptional LysR family regulator